MFKSWLYVYNIGVSNCIVKYCNTYFSEENARLQEKIKYLQVR